MLKKLWEFWFHEWNSLGHFSEPTQSFILILFHSLIWYFWPYNWDKIFFLIFAPPEMLRFSHNCNWHQENLRLWNCGKFCHTIYKFPFSKMSFEVLIREDTKFFFRRLNPLSHHINTLNAQLNIISLYFSPSWTFQ